jgi:hypothetical protein
MRLPAETNGGMTLADFRRSVSNAAPRAGVGAAVQALWWAAKGDWARAHALVMDDPGKDCAWVHAYLHRLEGDLGNAGYWYRQAGQVAAKDSLQAEWQRIAATLLGSKT